jgi:hypothetical protein
MSRPGAPGHPRIDLSDLRARLAITLEMLGELVQQGGETEDLPSDEILMEFMTWIQSIRRSKLPAHVRQGLWNPDRSIPSHDEQYRPTIRVYFQRADWDVEVADIASARRGLLERWLAVASTKTPRMTLLPSTSPLSAKLSIGGRRGDLLLPTVTWQAFSFAPQSGHHEPSGDPNQEALEGWLREVSQLPPIEGALPFDEADRVDADGAH